MAAERLFLDTNVLLAASDGDRPEHENIVAAFNTDWPGSGVTLYLSGQVMREYLSVATRPRQVNGLGLTVPQARGNMRAFSARTRFLDETEAVATRLLGLAEERDVGGKQVHDANIVATMLAHGVISLITLNPRDFRRFDDLIAVRGI